MSLALVVVFRKTGLLLVIVGEFGGPPRRGGSQSGGLINRANRNRNVLGPAVGLPEQRRAATLAEPVVNRRYRAEPAERVSFDQLEILDHRAGSGQVVARELSASIAMAVPHISQHTRHHVLHPAAHALPSCHCR